MQCPVLGKALGGGGGIGRKDIQKGRLPTSKKRGAGGGSGEVRAAGGPRETFGSPAPKFGGICLWTVRNPNVQDFYLPVVMSVSHVG